MESIFGVNNVSKVIPIEFGKTLSEGKRFEKERGKEVEMLLKQIRLKPQLFDIQPLFDFLFQKPVYKMATEDVFWWDLMWKNEFNETVDNYLSGVIYSGTLQDEINHRGNMGLANSEVLRFTLELTEQITGPLELMTRNGYGDNEEFTLDVAKKLLNTEYVKFMKFLMDYLESIDIRQKEFLVDYNGNPLKEFYIDLFSESNVIGVPYHYYLDGDVVHISYQTPNTYNKLHLSFNYNLSAAHAIDYDGFEKGVFVGFN